MGEWQSIPEESRPRAEAVAAAKAECQAGGGGGKASDGLDQRSAGRFLQSTQAYSATATLRDPR